MKPLRPIVSVNIDGKIHGFFESRKQAEELNKICHKDMGRALKNHYYTCRGFKCTMKMNIEKDGLIMEKNTLLGNLPLLIKDVVQDSSKGIL